MSMNQLETLKTEVKDELVNNILPFWSGKMIDTTNGGFFGRIDGSGRIYYDADKGCVLNARILWTFSSAYRVLKNPEYLKIAERSKDYLLKYFFDNEFGGVYWLINYRGEMKDGKKQIYAQAFAIYGLTEYYRVTKDKSCLEKAIELFHLIEKFSYDEKLGGANVVQTAEAQTGIKMMLSFFPAIGTLLGAFFMFIYPLSEKKMMTISAELAVRRETAKKE